ncbi:hypothetical protein IJT93_10485 [bacterium]|nr:hypothetical protein [bacterium]
MQFIRKKLTEFDNIERIKGIIAGAVSHVASPIISGGRTRLFELLGREYDGGLPHSDVFMTADGIIVFYNFIKEENAMIIGETYGDDQQGGLLQKAVEAILRAEPDIRCEDYCMVSPYFNLLREDSKSLRMEEWECRAAECMKNAGVRDLLSVIANKKSVSLPEAAQGRSVFEVGEDVQKMDELGIICREFEIYCKKTGQKVSCVSSLAALDEAAKRGFRCFHCGKAISDEQIVQSLSISEGGAKLAVHNMWLVYFVGAALKACGVKPEHILFRYEADYNFCDIFANYKGLLLMLTVSESGLNADSVFRIMSRAKFFHPDYVFAVSPSKVNAETLRLTETCEGNLSVVDELDNLEAAVKKVTAESDKRMIVRFLKDFDKLTCVDVGSIVGEYFLQTPDGSAVDLEEKLFADINSALSGKAKDKKKADSADDAAEEEIEVLGEAQTFMPEISDIIIGCAEKLRNYMIDMEETDAMEELLGKISSEEGCSAMIVGDDGMPLLGSMDSLDNFEDAAALLPELTASLNDSASEASMGNIVRICAAYKNGEFNIYPNADNMSLMIHSGSVGSLKFFGKPAKNDNLNKSLLGLTVIDNVFDAIIVQEDVVVDATTANCDDLALAVSRMCGRVNDYLSNDLGLGVWQCLSVETDTQLLAAYPLHDNSVIVCILDIKAADDSVWRKDIPGKLARVEAALI